MDWANLDRLRRRDEVKFVIQDRADYEFARGVVVRARLSPTGSRPSSSRRCTACWTPASCAAWILEDRLPVRLQLQVHKYIWGAATRGV